MLLLRSFYPMALGTSRENNISAPSVRTRSSPSVTVMGHATWFMGRVFIVRCATWFHFWVHNMPIHLHALIYKILGKFRTSTLQRYIVAVRGVQPKWFLLEDSLPPKACIESRRCEPNDFYAPEVWKRRSVAIIFKTCSGRLCNRPAFRICSTALLTSWPSLLVDHNYLSHSHRRWYRLLFRLHPNFLKT